MTDQPFLTYAFPASGAPTDRNTPIRLSDIVNVKDWGAVGNGSTDDTDAINGAIDYAYSLGDLVHNVSGAIVYFPPGTYRISKGGTVPLFLDRQFRIPLEVEGASYKGSIGQVTFMGAGRDVSVLIGDYDPGGQHEEDMNGFLVQNERYAAHVAGVRDLTIHNESTGRTSGAFISNGSGNNRFITNCHFIGMTGYACTERSFGNSVRDCIFTCSQSPTLASDADYRPKFDIDEFKIAWLATGVAATTAGVVTSITSLRTIDTGNNVIDATHAIGYTPGFTYDLTFQDPSGGGGHRATAQGTADGSGEITIASIVITDGGAGYTGVTASPGFQFPRNGNIFGTVGAYFGQGLISNCHATGFDVGFSILGAGTLMRSCTATQCGLGVVAGIRNGALSIGQLDSDPVPGGWHTLGAGEITACKFDRCTQGMYLYSVCALIAANTVTGTTGPTVPAALVTTTGLSWNAGTHIVTATTVDDHNLSGTPVIQIDPAGWTLDADGFVTVISTPTAKTFTYAGPLTTPPAFTTGTWNYPLEYGINTIASGSGLFAANSLEASVSIASFVAQGYNEGNTAVWATRGPYGWILPSLDIYAPAWEFEKCGGGLNRARSGTERFPAIPWATYLPRQNANIGGFPFTGMERTIVNCDSTAWSAVVSTSLVTTVSASGSVLTFASVPSYVNNTDGFHVDEDTHLGTGDNARTIASTTGTSVTLNSALSATLPAGSRIHFNRNRLGSSNKYTLRYDGEAWRRIA